MSISHLRGVIFIFILFQIEIPFKKQFRPWSDAALSSSDPGLCLKMGH